MKKVTISIYAILLSLSFAQERVILEGEYTYKWGDNETVLVAKSLCYNMALRNMVESYHTFVVSTTDIHNYEVRNDLIQTLSAGYLEDLTVVEERVEKEKNIAYYKLRAYVQPVEFKRVLQQEVKRKLNIYKPKSVRENHYFSVLRQWETGRTVLNNNLEFTTLCFILQFKMRVFTSNKAIYNVTFYDSEGFPLDGTAFDLIPVGTMDKGSVRKVCKNFTLPKGTAYYEIWEAN